MGYCQKLECWQRDQCEQHKPMQDAVLKLPQVLHILAFQNLKFKDLIRAMKVCRTWKQVIKNNYFLSTMRSGMRTGNLIIDIPRDLFIDEDLTVTGMLLIRASNIYSKPGVCVSGIKVTFVAKKIKYLGSIKAIAFDSYKNKSYVKGPMPGGTSYGLLWSYLHTPNFWSELVVSHSSQNMIFYSR